MAILEVAGLTHAFGDKLLYRGAELSLQKGEHMGVVGLNGAGKSTLVKLLSGELVPDEGRIAWQNGCRVGVLSQYAEVDGGKAVEEFLRSAFAPLYGMERRTLALYDRAAAGEADALARAAALQEVLEAAGFYALDVRLEQVAIGLGLTAYGMDTRLEALSGGQRAKVILGKLLLEGTDVLLLDEPTNFLDREHVSWLADFLRGFPGAYLIVSHDFDFLERITDCICDVEFQSLKKYAGCYSDFVRQKGALRQDYLRRYEAQQREIARTEAYIRKNKAGVNSKMARGRQKQLDRLERLAPPAFTGRPQLRFTASPLLSRRALEVENLVVGYGRPLLPGLSFSVLSGQKLVVTGFNGIGKSTLMKTLTGAIPALAGEFRFADAARIGYYEQELRWEREERTPLAVVAESYPRLTEREIRRSLAQCGVRADSIRQPMRTLSGGEQSKVKLCALLLAPRNFLILDEPTNHLDAAAREALSEALRAFEGSAIVVSHEESFYRGWADDVVRIGEGS